MNLRRFIGCGALVALSLPALADDGVVLVSEGMGPRAIEGLRRELASASQREVLGLHDEGSESVDAILSVSVLRERLVVQYRVNGRSYRATGPVGRRRQMLQVILDVMEEGGALAPANAPSASTSSTPSVRENPTPRSTAVPSPRVQGVLLATADDEEAVATAMAPAVVSESATEERSLRVEGILLASADDTSPPVELSSTSATVSQPAPVNMLLATSADDLPIEESGESIRTGGVLLFGGDPGNSE